MTEELISKKDLLKQMNISYGQLYRWKRKNLIPEEWFIKKSVTTGQETFFPKEEIVERIEKIIELKDQVSLDELADIFSDKVVKENEDTILNYSFSDQVLILFEKVAGAALINTDIENLLVAKILRDYVLSGEITLDEGKLIYQFLNTHFQTLKIGKGNFVLLRYLGNSLVLGSLGKENLIFSHQTKCILEIDVLKEIEDLKLASI